MVSYAALQIQGGRLDKALAILNGVMISWPGMTRAYSNRALVYYNRKQFDPARADAVTALRLNPGNTQAAALLERLGR